MILSYAFAIAIPMVLLYLIWSLEIYAFGKHRLLMLSFAWGMAMFLVALFVQDLLIDRQLISYSQVVLFSAPVLEELLKALLIIFLMQTMSLRYTVEGTTYGFAVGTGFAVIENLFYITIGANAALADVLLRIFSVSLMHAFNSAIIGTVAGTSSFHGARVRVPRMVSVVLFSMLVHALFNLIAVSTQAWALIAFSVSIGIGGTLTIILIAKNSLTSESRAIQSALTEKLSAGELAAVVSPFELAQIVEEKSNLLGDRRRDLIAEYITLQAQRGIIYKTLSMNQRTSYEARLRAQLETLELRLNALQGSMGMVNRLWLRSILPSDERQIWETLNIELGENDALLSLILQLGQRQAELSDGELKARLRVVSRTSLFQDLPENDRLDLALMLNSEQYEIGDVVIAQGEIAKRLFIVEQGSLIASVTDDEGLETIITTHVQDEHFGELSLIDDIENPSQVICIAETKIYTLHRNDFITLIYAHPEIALVMMRKLVEDIRQRTELISWIRQTEQSSPRSTDTNSRHPYASQRMSGKLLNYLRSLASRS